MSTGRDLAARPRTLALPPEMGYERGRNPFPMYPHAGRSAA